MVSLVQVTPCSYEASGDRVVVGDKLIIFSIVDPTDGKTSLKWLPGRGSRRQIVW